MVDFLTKELFKSYFLTVPKLTCLPLQVSLYLKKSVSFLFLIRLISEKKRNNVLKSVNTSATSSEVLTQKHNNHGNC